MTGDDLTLAAELLAGLELAAPQDLEEGVRRAADVLSAVPDLPGADPVLDAIERLAGHDSWHVRLSVARALPILPRARCERLAVLLSGDSTRYVQDAAKRALRELRKAEREEAKLAREARLVAQRTAKLERKVPGAARAVRDLAREEITRRQGRALHDLAALLASLVNGNERLRRDLEPRPGAGNAWREISAATARTLQLARATIEELSLYSDPTPPSFERVHVREVVDEALEQVRARLAGARGRPAVRQEIDVPRHLIVEAPRPRFVRALANVIRNAFEALDRPGKVRLRAQSEAGQLVIEVEDTGEGIPPEFRPFLFLPGQSLKKGRPGRDNRGWGLAVTQRVIEDDCGGRIQVESEPGQGTKVTIFLPLEQAAPRGEEVAA